MRPGEQDLGGQERADAGLVEQLRGELADEPVDLAGELALFERQLLDAAGDRAEREAACRAARGRVGVRAVSRRAGRAAGPV